MPLLIAAGCTWPYEFHSCDPVYCMGKLVLPGGLWGPNEGLGGRILIDSPDNCCSAYFVRKDVTLFGVAINFPEAKGYFTGRFDTDTGYPIFINFDAPQNSASSRTI